MRLLKTFNRYARPTGIALAAGLASTAPVQATSKLSPNLEPAIPQITIGDINQENFQKFHHEFADLKRKVGKGTRIYVHVDSNGGLLKTGNAISSQLNNAYDQGYNIRLVCKKAYSMAANIFLEFKGNRFATEDCKFMTHASYFGQYVKKTLPNPFSLKNPIVLTRFQVVAKLDSPHITTEQKQSIEKNVEDFAKGLSDRSCKIPLKGAFKYFTAKDKYMGVPEMLDKNIADDVVRINTLGRYEIDYSYRQYKNNCLPTQENIVPSRQNLMGWQLRQSLSH